MVYFLFQGLFSISYQSERKRQRISRSFAHVEKISSQQDQTDTKTKREKSKTHDARKQSKAQGERNSKHNGSEIRVHSFIAVKGRYPRPLRFSSTS